MGASAANRTRPRPQQGSRAWSERQGSCRDADANKSDDPGVDGLPTLTYQVRLKKRCGPDSLLGALRERLGPQLAEYSPHGSGAEVQGTAT